MEPEQIIGLVITAFVFGLLIGSFLMNTLYIKADRKRRQSLSDFREWPCHDCATGEMIYTGSTPGHKGYYQHFKCDRCGAGVTMP